MQPVEGDALATVPVNCGAQMHLVQLLLPLATTSDEKKIESVVENLTSQFGGATAFVNSPALGLWASGGERMQDRIVTVEVMVDDFDPRWWSASRKLLEKAFKQEEIVVRAIEITKV